MQLPHVQAESVKPQRKPYSDMIMVKDSTISLKETVDAFTEKKVCKREADGSGVPKPSVSHCLSATTQHHLFKSIYCHTVI